MTEQRTDLGLTASTPPRGGCGDACGCGHGGAAAATSDAPDASTTQELRVDGMTCAHCVRAVTDELNAVPGVRVVDVDLRAGETSLVRVSSTGVATPDDLAAAIDEAGYTLA
ncbi:heavy metal-associated domain-containing protein [uncultured Microbacterium sp.]|uniref:heavy-metal-associated domain-containing protein n=1 Tax=uncultured Microbacterium sp. TaxID=191216 RepID=UPI0025CCE48F|nr:heavy metal-associated domain-containing protein [uncultured Microbacterium sp.]